MNRMSEDIIAAIVAQHAPGLVKEQAGELIQGWINKFERLDRDLNIVAVEQPWYEWLNDNTLAVGVRDLVLENGVGEWKTHRAPRTRKDGQFYEGEGPEPWAAKMHDSIQLALYARTDAPTEFLCRAAIKTSPPTYWQKLITVSPERAQLARHALIVQAEIIRAARRCAPPWRFPDAHKPFNRPCLCSARDSGKISTLIQSSDPGAAAVEMALAERGTVGGKYSMPDDLVVLSASAYEASVQCLEGYRRTLGSEGVEEESEALQLGSCFHAGLAVYYQHLMEEKK